ARVRARSLRTPGSEAGSRARRCAARAASRDACSGGRSHATRARGAAARRDGAYQSADRSRARAERENGGSPREQHLREARRAVARSRDRVRVSPSARVSRDVDAVMLPADMGEITQTFFLFVWVV